MSGSTPQPMLQREPVSERGERPRLQAVLALEQQLRARKGRRLRSAATTVAVAAFATAGLWLSADKDAAPATERYVLAAVETRDIVETVESSGKLRPVKEVQVGTQVSGRVVEVHVDFNSRVREGDLLAEIDPSLLGAQVNLVAGQLDTAKAQLKRALASLKASARTRERMVKLQREAVVSRIELDSALSAAEVAEADVVAARARIAGLTAQLRGANTTLAYTKIHSPIDGVVINRAVDPGQTVAASFAAPVLFVIAQDLKAMQVLADIDEADVGKVAEGMAAQVSVDAFPGQHFEASVTQLRFSPTEVQGVVTYAAVLDVANDGLKLRPGMTATVSIATKTALKAAAVPNSALRFRPRKMTRPREKLRYEQRRLYRLSDSVQRPAMPPAMPPARSSSESSATAEQAARTPATAASTVLEPILIEVGITDGLWTQISAGAPDVGTQIVTRENQPKKSDRRKFLGIF